VVTTSWSTSLCHRSATVGEVSGSGGCGGACTASNVHSRPAADGIIAVIAAEYYCRVVAVVVTTTLVVTRVFVRRDRPALE
jgi:hypothetical protein